MKKRKGATTKTAPMYERIEEWLLKWWPIIFIIGGTILFIYMSGD